MISSSRHGPLVQLLRFQLDDVTCRSPCPRTRQPDNNSSSSSKQQQLWLCKIHPHTLYYTMTLLQLYTRATDPKKEGSKRKECAGKKLERRKPHSFPLPKSDVRLLGSHLFLFLFFFKYIGTL